MSWLMSASEIGDVDGERTVVAIVALLAVLGVALVMLAIWMWRVTRPDPEVLAPLELMGERSWLRRDPVAQRRKLDEVRPQGATPLTRPSAPPDLDEAFDAGPRAVGLTDLRDYAIDGASADPAASGQGSLASRGGDGPDDEPGDRVEIEDPPSRTPPAGIDRPVSDDLDDFGELGDLGDRVIDPQVLAEAEAALDEELDGGARPG